jgi:hypothetical protein
MHFLGLEHFSHGRLVPQDHLAQLELLDQRELPDQRAPLGQVALPG